MGQVPVEADGGDHEREGQGPLEQEDVEEQREVVQERPVGPVGRRRRGGGLVGLFRLRWFLRRCASRFGGFLLLDLFFFIRLSLRLGLLVFGLDFSLLLLFWLDRNLLRHRVDFFLLLLSLGLFGFLLLRRLLFGGRRRLLELRFLRLVLSFLPLGRFLLSLRLYLGPGPLLGLAVAVTIAVADVVFRKCRSRRGDARPRREVAGGSGRSSGGAERCVLLE